MKRLTPLVLLILGGCTNTGAANEPSAGAPSQRWICGREYVNFAWGYQRHGVVLDGEGHVWAYEFKGSPTSLPNPWQPRDLDALTEDELRVRYNGAVDTGKHADPSDIARHLATIAN